MSSYESACASGQPAPADLHPVLPAIRALLKSHGLTVYEYLTCCGSGWYEDGVNHNRAWQEITIQFVLNKREFTT